MRLVVSGGGTGGHVYPAIEVARLARDRGAEVLYLGSLRGQEAKACQAHGFDFRGYPTHPFYGFRSVAGWKALLAFAKARSSAKSDLLEWKPDAVFSTGGYGAAPVVSSARALGIPYLLHSADSVPAKSSRMYANKAAGFTSVFKSTPTFAPGVHFIRTGHPLRRELREAAIPRETLRRRQVLVVGGSQGSEFLNQQVPLAAKLLKDVNFLHGSGPKNLQATLDRIRGLQNYEVKPYFSTDEMLQAYKEADLVIARSGGTLAELALFGLPSILVPLPTSADDHQLHNAEEFVEMKAATLLRQGSEATPERIAEEVELWLGNRDKQEQASAALAAWDVPDATERIVKLLEQAAL